MIKDWKKNSNIIRYLTGMCVFLKNSHAYYLIQVTVLVRFLRFYVIIFFLICNLLNYLFLKSTFAWVKLHNDHFVLFLRDLSKDTNKFRLYVRFSKETFFLKILFINSRGLIKSKTLNSNNVKLVSKFDCNLLI